MDLPNVNAYSLTALAILLFIGFRHYTRINVRLTLSILVSVTEMCMFSWTLSLWLVPRVCSHPTLEPLDSLRMRKK